MNNKKLNNAQSKALQYESDSLMKDLLGKQYQNTAVTHAPGSYSGVTKAKYGSTSGSLGGYAGYAPLTPATNPFSMPTLDDMFVNSRFKTSRRS